MSVTCTTKGCQILTSFIEPVVSFLYLDSKGRGFNKEFVDTKNSIVVTAWFGNKRVHTVSNYIGTQPLGSC